MRKKSLLRSTPATKKRSQSTKKTSSHLEESPTPRTETESKSSITTDIVRQAYKQDGLNNLFPIIGIGASAGGLTAFSQLLKTLPINSGMAFVLIQHLEPHHKSLLTQLLAKYTNLPVLEAVDGVVIKPDQIYVVPSNVDMTIVQGSLKLSLRTDTNGRHMLVDTFFCSLAEDCQNRAVGVILSGKGSDGVLGLQAIKAAGGITFAQDCVSAKYRSMPENAITAGNVDFVLSPTEIAKKIVELCAHSNLRDSLLDEHCTQPDIDEKFTEIIALLRTATGTDFTHYKFKSIKRRIIRRLVLHKINNIDDYLLLLHDNQQELTQLYQDILICVTNFFRDIEVFQALTKNIFPGILKQKNFKTPLRVWVPGCSTGE